MIAIDLLQPTQDAVFVALAAATMPHSAIVRQHVKQGQEPPFVKVGQIDTENVGGKGEQAERITVEVQTIFRGEARGPLLDIMGAVRAALDGQVITAGGVNFSTPTFLGATASDAGPDGVTYAGISHFEIFAEPA